MATSSDFTTLIARKVGADTRGLVPGDFVEPAVRIFERYRPREVAEDVTGDGTGEYALASAVSHWVPGFSRIDWIEYPTDQDPPIYIDDGAYFVRRVANTGSNQETRVEKLKFRAHEPSSSESFRVNYTTRHTVNGTYSSVPVEDEHAVADFGAALMLEEIAVRYSGLKSQEGLLAEVVIAYEEKAQAARDNARAARRRARMALGLAADERGDEAVAGTFVATRDFDIALHGGRGSLTHPRYSR